jgi:hypothetical protein
MTVLLAVALVLAASAVGLVVAQAQAGSFVPLLEAGFFSITPSAGPGGAIDPDVPQVVAEGGSQAFTITPALGHHVADVLVDGGSVGPVTNWTFDNVTADHTISATFAIDAFTITSSVGANGTISPLGAQTVDYGADQAFTITPATGYHVADVVVDGGSVGAQVSYTFTSVTADHTIRATFAIDTFTITPTAGPNGAISPGAPQTVAYGGSRAFTILPATGYHVADVLVDGSSVGARASYLFSNVTADHTISASFAIDAFTITPTAGPNGAISPATPQIVQYGGSQTFTITPATGYHIADVAVDGTSVGAPAGYTFSSVSADHGIAATFAVDTFTITPTAGPNGAISPATPQAVAFGGSQTFTVTPATGYHVVDVLVDGGSVGAVPSYTFTDVTADHTISASFAIDAFTITPSAGPHGAISPSTPQPADYGEDRVFTITPAADYYIADVLVDGVSVGPVASYTFVDVAADHTISATFAVGIKTALWMSISPPVVTYGQATTLLGELRDDRDPSSPVGLGGRLVKVQHSPFALGPWVDLGEYETSSLPGAVGQFSVTLSPAAPSYYRLRYVPVQPTEYGGALTDNRRVGVRPSLGRPVPPASARAGRWFTVYGPLRPHFTAGEKTVKVKVQRYRNGRWVSVKTLAATNVDNGAVTRYRLRVRFTTRGKYRFVATSTPVGWATATTSPSRTTLVR